MAREGGGACRAWRSGGLRAARQEEGPVLCELGGAAGSSGAREKAESCVSGLSGGRGFCEGRGVWQSRGGACESDLGPEPGGPGQDLFPFVRGRGAVRVSSEPRQACGGKA